MKKALLVIDVQNDYFPGGKFPLWEADRVLEGIVASIGAAQRAGVPVIVLQHIARESAPFFVQGTSGAALHDRIAKSAPAAHVITKSHADSFEGTQLASLLEARGVEELLLCGMMTQNCVAHTALAKAAEKYRVAVLTDGCTTVTEVLHKIALRALSTRVRLATWSEALDQDQSDLSHCGLRGEGQATASAD